MIKKTGREIYRLRKAKIGLGELDRHRFQEKLAFFTTSKGDHVVVPPIFEECLNSTSSRSSTLKHADPPPSMISADICESADKVHIHTSSGDETHSSSSSTCSTPTPHIKREADQSGSTERFSYDIDPDIGVIVWRRRRNSQISNVKKIVELCAMTECLKSITLLCN